VAQAFLIGGLQEPGTEVSVNFDARSEDSLGQLPQSPGLPVPMIHTRIYSWLSTPVQPYSREIAMIGGRPRAHATPRPSQRITPPPAPPPPRLPVNPSPLLLLTPPNKRLVLTVHRASLRSARRPAAHPRGVRRRSTGPM